MRKQIIVMIRFILFLSLAFALLVSCTSDVHPSTEKPVVTVSVLSAQGVSSLPPLPSSTTLLRTLPIKTISSFLTSTVEPTSTVTPTPSPTITPMPENSITPHPLALNEHNVSTQMEQLARFGQGTLYDVEWSPDGKYLAVSTGLGIYLYDAGTLEQVRFLDINNQATLIAFNPSGTALAVALDSKIEIWDVESSRKTMELSGEIEGGIYALVFGEGGYVAAIGQLARGLGESVPQIKIWKVSTGHLIYSYDHMYGWTVAVDVSPDGKMIAFFGGDGMAVHDFQTGEKILGVSGDFDAVFDPDNINLFTTSWDWMDTGEKFTVWMTTLASGETSVVLDGTQCQYLSRNVDALICYGANNVTLFNPTDGKALKTFYFPSGLTDAAISPDGHYLAILDQKEVNVLDTQSGQEIESYEFPYLERFAVGMIRLDDIDYYTMAISASDGLIRVVDLANGTTLGEYQLRHSNATGLAFSPDRSTLAVIDNESIVRLWDIHDGVMTYKFDLSSAKADGPIIFSPDGKKLALTDVYQENTYELDLQTGVLKSVGGNPSGYIYASTLAYGWYSYTPDNHLVTWGQTGENIVFKDMSANVTINLPYESESDSTFVEAIARSPDGNYLATGLVGAEILVWDLHKQELIRTLHGHEMRGADGWMGAIRHLAFSPQSDLLVSVGWDGTTRLWDIHSGTQLQNLETCCFSEFSLDGRILVTAGDSVFYVWGIPPWP